MPDFRFVDLAVDDNLIAALQGVDRIGVDTEFMREKTYFAELCLLQVSTPSEIVCADPLGVAECDAASAQAFWEALARPEWVLHSARQDLEVVFHTAGIMPDNVFDTQVAAALLGFQPQIGYAGLVKALFDVELDKSHTRADWSKRPLSDALLNYAAEDVQYLLPARDELTKRLEDRHRLEWAWQDSKDLLDRSLYDVDPSTAIQRLKGARNLRGRQRAAATALASWRESEALRKNLPRQWIMRDQVLIEIAVSNPSSPSQLADIDGLAERTVRRAGDRLLAIVAAATRDGSGYQPPSRPTERQKAALKEMQKCVADCAHRHDIAAELIAPRKELSAAMQGERALRVFRGWREELVGGKLLEILERQ